MHTSTKAADVTTTVAIKQISGNMSSHTEYIMPS